MKTPIAIVDYGMANLRSVEKAFAKLGHAAVVTGDPNRIAEADKVVLPGVGAFQDAIARLREVDLATPLCRHVRADKPFLGICLGLQLLFDRGYEDGIHEGLGLFPGDVVRFTDEPGLKVPHMGWNQLHLRQPHALWEGIAEGDSVYFVHSYYVVPADPALVAAETDYPKPFTSAIGRGRVFATQFHPEKSQRVGLRILDNFARLA